MSATPAPSPKPLLLIVDDQPENVHALASILAGEARTIFALNGEQALARVAERPVDLILLDVMLPGINGFAVCEALKANPATAHIPVIFVSGLSEGQDEERGFAVGAVDYVHKPFLPAVVRARVRTHLKLQAALRELAALARTDVLTGLWNRRHFDERLDIEVERSRQHRLPLSLVLLDLDHFKSINDRLGHAVGDQVLVGTAERMRTVLRRSDVAARWGGEEFALLVSGNLSEAVEMAEWVRRRMAETPFDGVGVVTLSAGVAQFLWEDPVSAWFERADRSMYQAKAAGRNRSVADPRLP